MDQLTFLIYNLPNCVVGPQVFREDSIISGYRHPRSSALDCVLSSFQMTNETVNIWTHFLPTWCVQQHGHFLPVHLMWFFKNCDYCKYFTIETMTTR